MKIKKRGSMLVMALWTLMLLSVFSVSLGFGVRQKASLLLRLSTLDALYPIAYSGVEYAKSLVKSDPDINLDSFLDPWAAAADSSHAVRVEGGSFSLVGCVPVTDEESKININQTTAEILIRLLRTVPGLSKDNAEEIAYNILDWMDSDSAFGHPKYGAETSYYEGLDKPYSAKDAPFETIDELLLVKGITPEIFEKIRPGITVYGSGTVNINTANAQVLSALGFSSDSITSLLHYRMGDDGKDGTSDDHYFKNESTVATDLKEIAKTPLESSQEILLAGLIQTGHIGVTSTFFSVTSRGVLEKNGAAIQVEAVFNRKAQVFYQRMGNIEWPKNQSN